MAPFEQRRELLNNAYPLHDDSMDELQIEARSHQKGNQNNKHADRDNFVDDPSYFNDYPSTSTSATTSPSLTTPTTSIVYGSPTSQPPSSLVCLTRF